MNDSYDEAGWAGDNHHERADRGEDGDEELPLADRISLYVATLTARMSSENFAVLADALHQWQHIIADGAGEGVLDIDEDTLNPEVRKELILVMAMCGSGRTDLQAVDMPAEDGSPGTAILPIDVASDPERLAQARKEMHDWAREQRKTAETLAGIEEASARERPGPS